MISDNNPRVAHVRNLGGYLTNTRRGPGFCTRCCGPKPDNPHSTCFSCGMEWGSRDPVRGIFPLVYGGYNDQSRRLFYGYKSELIVSGASNASLIRTELELNIAMLLVVGLEIHRGCIEERSAELTSIAAVPSSNGRDSLDRIVTAVAQTVDLPLLRISYSGPKGGRRAFKPEWYAAERPTVGEHVLVVDDTWVSGSRPRSVAAAVTTAGAELVSVLTGARWLKDTWGPSRPFFDDSERQPPFDPLICPVSGGACSP